MTPQDVAPTEAPPQGPAHAAPWRAHILVADDCEVVCRFVKDVLEIAGHRATVVHDGEAALWACAKDPPEVVITDLAMSPVSGRELIEALQRDHPTIVPIVLTGYGTVERTVDLMRVGAFDVLTKPCREKEITATVVKALSHHRALKARDELLERLAEHETSAERSRAASVASAVLLGPLEQTLRHLESVSGSKGRPESHAEELALAYAGVAAAVSVLRACGRAQDEPAERADLQDSRPGPAEIQAELRRAVARATQVLQAHADSAAA
jgi:FixJ family two-component response regulator